MAMDTTRARRTFSLLAYVVMAAAAAYLLIGRHGTTLPINAQAPIEEQITLLNGDITTFKSFIDRPLVVNFWATWCPVCLKELPVFGDAEKKYRHRINFLGIAVASKKEDVSQIKNKFSIAYPLGFTSATTVDKWYSRALPTTYIVDKSGKILWAKAGSLTQKQLEEAIKGALGEKSS